METIAFTLAGGPRAAHHERQPPFVRIVKPIASTVSPSLAIAASDEDLFERFLLGEERAFTLLFERHNRRVYYYSAKLVQDSRAAEDITQTMWERVIEIRASSTMHSRPATVRNVPGLLFRIARNLSLDYLKHHRKQSPLDSLSESVSSMDGQQSGDDELSEREQMVLDCMEALPLASRELLVLHYYSGYSFEEIAAMTGKKPNAIWTRASRARANLKSSIEKRLSSLPMKSSNEKETI
jgi:RNA polymerase sigma factor (sigma-70 family)